MEIALMSASSPLYSAVKVISSVVIFSALIALQINQIENLLMGEKFIQNKKFVI